MSTIYSLADYWWWLMRLQLSGTAFQTSPTTWGNPVRGNGHAPVDKPMHREFATLGTNNRMKLKILNRRIYKTIAPSFEEACYLDSTGVSEPEGGAAWGWNPVLWGGSVSHLILLSLKGLIRPFLRVLEQLRIEIIIVTGTICYHQGEEANERE